MGTSAGVKKGWMKRKRGTPYNPSDVMTTSRNAQHASTGAFVHPSNKTASHLAAARAHDKAASMAAEMAEAYYEGDRHDYYRDLAEDHTVRAANHRLLAEQHKTAKQHTLYVISETKHNQKRGYQIGSETNHPQGFSEAVVKGFPWRAEEREHDTSGADIGGKAVKHEVEPVKKAKMTVEEMKAKYAKSPIFKGKKKPKVEAKPEHKPKTHGQWRPNFLKLGNAKRTQKPADKDMERGGLDWDDIDTGDIRPGTDCDCGEGVTLHRHSNGSYRLSEPSKIPGRRAHHLISREHAQRIIKNLRKAGRLKNSAPKENHAMEYKMLTDHVARTTKAGKVPHPDILKRIEHIKNLHGGMPPKVGNSAEDRAEITGSLYNYNYGISSETDKPYNFLTDPGQAAAMPNKDEHTCTACGGTGVKDRAPCPSCGGTGEVNTTGKEHKLPKQSSDTEQYLRTKPMTNSKMKNQLVSTPPPKQSDPPSEQYMQVDSNVRPSAGNGGVSASNAGTSMQSDAPAGSELGNAHDPKELKKGVKDEMKEHDMGKAEATKTAKQHLSRVDEHYYTKTEKAMKNDNASDNATTLAAKRVASTEASGRENDGDENIEAARKMMANDKDDPDHDGDMHNCKPCKMHSINNCNICNESADGESPSSDMPNSRVGDLSSSPMIGGKKMDNKVLTAAGRKHISKKNFALPGGRYPIHDKAHARNALARVSQFGTSSEKAKVRAAVHKKYPGIGNRAKELLALEPTREEIEEGVRERYPKLSNRGVELAVDILTNAKPSQSSGVHEMHGQ